MNVNVALSVLIFFEGGGKDGNQTLRWDVWVAVKSRNLSFYLEYPSSLRYMPAKHKRARTQQEMLISVANATRASLQHLFLAQMELGTS